MLVRRETPADIDAIRAVTAAAFATADGPGPGEAGLVDELRASDAWLPALSLVAVDGPELLGHVVCTRAHVGTAPVLALGPLSVRPDRQRQGVGSALVHAVLGAADALDEPLVALLGHLDYYPRFGFRQAVELGLTPPRPWGPAFMARPLAAHTPQLRGEFAYAAPFDRFS
jgi:putative acetyltransferase